MKFLKSGLIAAVPALVLAMQTHSAQAADAVCAATQSQGVVCLTDGGMKIFGRDSGLKSTRIRDLVTCGDKILALTSRNVVSFDGSEWKSVNDLPRGLYGSEISCDSKGNYWVASSRTVGYWNGDAWKLFEAKDILQGERTTSVKDVAAGPNGTAWIVAFGGIAAYYDGNAWKKYKKDEGFQRRNVFNTIYIDKKNNVWLPTVFGLMTFKDGKWVEAARRTGSSAITEDKDGTLWIANNRNVNQVKNDAVKQIKGDRSIRGLAVDGKGRVWAATEFGLAMLSGDTWDSRQMHNSSLPDNNIRRVAVLGNGADLPNKVTKDKASISGRVEWQNGDPVANAEIEICGVSRGIILFGRGGPCEGQPLAAKAKTDADGKFAIEKIETASYRFSIKPVESQRWIRVFLSSNRLLVQAGQVKKIGTIRLNDRFREKKK